MKRIKKAPTIFVDANGLFEFVLALCRFEFPMC